MVYDSSAGVIRKGTITNAALQGRPGRPGVNGPTGPTGPTADRLMEITDRTGQPDQQDQQGQPDRQVLPLLAQVTTRQMAVTICQGLLEPASQVCKGANTTGSRMQLSGNHLRMVYWGNNDTWGFGSNNQALLFHISQHRSCIPGRSWFKSGKECQSIRGFPDAYAEMLPTLRSAILCGITQNKRIVCG